MSGIHHWIHWKGKRFWQKGNITLIHTEREREKKERENKHWMKSAGHIHAVIYLWQFPVVFSRLECSFCNQPTAHTDLWTVFVWWKHLRWSKWKTQFSDMSSAYCVHLVIVKLLAILLQFFYLRTFDQSRDLIFWVEMSVWCVIQVIKTFANVQTKMTLTEFGINPKCENVICDEMSTIRYSSNECETDWIIIFVGAIG